MQQFDKFKSLKFLIANGNHPRSIGAAHP
jgi:hypothetical protein